MKVACTWRWAWALLLATSAAFAPAFAQGADAPRPAAPDSPAAQALREQPVGQDPSAAFAWISAWSQVFPASEFERRPLTRGLLDLYLRQANGEDWPRDATLASALRAGSQLPPLAASPDETRRWQAALQRALVALPPTAPVAEPPEVLGVPTEALAPGLWFTRRADGQPRNVVWAVQVQHRGPVVIAPHALQAEMANPQGGEPLLLDCPAVRGQPRALKPGQSWRLVCLSRNRPGRQDRALLALAAALGSATPPPVQWLSAELARSASGAGLDPMIDALAESSPTTRAAVAAYAQRHAACESRGRCVAERRAPHPPPAGREDWRDDGESRTRPGRAAPPPAQGQQKAQAQAQAQSRPLFLGLAAAIAGFMVFCAIARSLGPRWAVLVLLLPAALWAWQVGQGHGAASLLLVGGSVAGAVVLSVLALMAYWMYDALVFSRFSAISASAARPAARALRHPPGRRRVS
jgi:hypothetical protein